MTENKLEKGAETYREHTHAHIQLSKMPSNLLADILELEQCEELLHLVVVRRALSDVRNCTIKISLVECIC